MFKLQNKKNIVIFLIIFLLAGFVCFSALKGFSSQLSKRLVILSTNDVHGNLDPLDYKWMKEVGGVSRRKTLINEIKENNKNVLLLDAGDYAQGTLYFEVFKNDVNTEAMELLDYDSIQFGNHEYEKGLDHIKQVSRNNKIDFLTSNIVFHDKELNKNIKKYVIKDFDGLKVGIIGVITEDLNHIVTSPLDIKVLNPEKTIRKIVNKIDKDTDLIIVLSHCGFAKDKEIASRVNGIDVIVGGHSHTYLKNPFMVNNGRNKVLITQNGEFGVSVGELDLVVENDKVKTYNFTQNFVSSRLKKNLEMEEFLAKYHPKLIELNQNIVGEIETPIDCRRDMNRKSLTTAGALMGDAIKDKYPEVEIVLQHSGSIRQGTIIPSGEISQATVMEMFPFNETIVILELKGKDIVSSLETSSSKLPRSNPAFLQSLGLEYTLNLACHPQKASKDFNKIVFDGERVKNVKVNSVPLDYNKYYKVAINSYMYNKGDGFLQFKKGKNVKITPDRLDSVVMEYIKKHSPVAIQIKDKIHLEK